MTLQVAALEGDGGGQIALSPGADPNGSALDEARRQTAISDILQLLGANERLRDALASNSARYEASLLQLLGGAEPGHLLDGMDVSRWRTELGDSLARFEQARHAVRATLITAQFEAGQTMREIARQWGVSRQLVHRFISEVRGADGAAPGSRAS